MGVISTILNAIFGSRCLACGAEGDDLCADCLAEFPSSERTCADWVFPAYDYRHPAVRKAVRLLKYGGRKRLGGIFARALLPMAMEELSDLLRMENFKDPVFVPIPLSRKRLQERGYNQAELLSPLSEKGILVKTKETEHQARIPGRGPRARNIAGTFSVGDPGKVRGRNIVLFDDVVTTGATLGEAKKILEEAGARKVIAITVAH